MESSTTRSNQATTFNTEFVFDDVVIDPRLVESSSRARTVPVVAPSTAPTRPPSTPASLESEVVPARKAPNQKWAVKDDWIKHRDEIKRLYRTYKLKDVMRIMEERRQFYASERMYKQRIRRWGLDKKSKEPEMKAMARIYTERRSNGKDTRFKVRNEEVSIGRLLEYWKRKSKSIEEISRQRPSAMPKTLTFYTPVPSPPSTPREFAEPESLLLNLRDYIVARFEDGTWTERSGWLWSSKAGRNTTAELDQLGNSVISACYLFNDGDHVAARRILASGMATLQDLIPGEDPEALHTLLVCSLEFDGMHRPELSHMLLEHASMVADTFLPKDHILRRVYRDLPNQSSHHIRTVEAAIRLTVDELGHRSTSEGRTSMLFRAEYLETVLNGRDLVGCMRHLDKIPQTYREHGGGGPKACEVIAGLATLVENTGAGGPTAFEVRTLLDESHRRLDYYLSTADLAMGYEFYAACEFKAGRLEVAEWFLRMAVSFSTKAQGEGHVATVALVEKLYTWLCQWKRCDEAARLDVCRQGLVLPVDEEGE